MDAYIKYKHKAKNNKNMIILYRDLDDNSIVIIISGIEVIIDKEDFEKIVMLGFHKCVPDHSGNIYFEHVVYNHQKVIEYIKLHRYLVNAPRNKIVDHANGNTLDNRKSNLRICTHAENTRNQKISRRNTSGFKGVRCLPGITGRGNGKKYQARIRHEGKLINLGVFSTPEQAYRAYCEASKKYHGEFGRIQ
jgi:hypothetical protein